MLTPEAEKTLIHRLLQYGTTNLTSNETYHLENILDFIQSAELRKKNDGESRSKLDTFLKNPENFLQIPSNEFSQIKETLLALGYQFNEKYPIDQSRSNFMGNEALLFQEKNTKHLPRRHLRSSMARKRPGARRV